MGRKSLGGGALAAVAVGENDDARERLERRKSLMQAQTDSARKAKKPKVNYDFSSVINMCSANKVNVNNTWSLDLIDHIDDVLESQAGSFQKVSCTLQASVQIYEKRVDSTHQDTFKMLENVNRTRIGTANDAEESRENRRKAPSKNTSVSTFLESNLSNITHDGDFERELEVDPLFRKMSKNFDSGGASGLLLNHLKVHNGPVVIFDTSDTMAFPEEEPSEEQGADKSKTFKFDAAIPASNVSPICPSLETLHRNIGSSPNQYENDNVSEINGESIDQDEQKRIEGEEDDFMFDHEFIEDDHFVGGCDDEDDFQGFNDEEDIDQENTAGHSTSNKPAGPGIEVDFTQFDAYSFFKVKGKSGQSSTSWVGPSHWRPGGMPKKVTAQLSGAKTEVKSKRKAKKTFLIDFSDLESPKNYECPFKHPARVSTINLTKKSQQPTKGIELPEDHHYTIHDLCKLFLKPVVISEALQGNKTAAAAAAAAGFGFAFGENDQGMTGFDGGDEAGFFDDVSPDNFGGAAANLVQPSHVVGKIKVGHATRAKQIDVKKLKESIWAEIEEETKPELSFTESIAELAPKIDNDQVTVPFYFISLLHLANENNLILQHTDDLADLKIQKEIAE